MPRFIFGIKMNKNKNLTEKEIAELVENDCNIEWFASDSLANESSEDESSNVNLAY